MAFNYVLESAASYFFFVLPTEETTKALRTEEKKVRGMQMDGKKLNNREETIGKESDRF